MERPPRSGDARATRNAAGSTSPRRPCRRARSPASMRARGSSTAWSARSGGTSDSPTATSATCPRLRPGQRRAPGLLPRGGRRPHHHPAAPVPHEGRRAPRAHALGARHRLRAPAPRTHVRAGAARRHRRVLRRRPRPRCSPTRTRSTACTSARPPRVGPDGRLRYGWDERLRLGTGAGAARVRTDARRRAPRACPACFDGYERGSSVAALSWCDGSEFVRIPTKHVWWVDVR